MARRTDRDRAPDVTLEPTRPSELGAHAWSAIAGPWEIDYSYASMRAIEAHPFNDSTGPRTVWWAIKRDGMVIGLYAAYVTETYNFATLFMVGWLRRVSAVADAIYRWLNRRGMYRHLERIRLARLLRIAAGRTRVMFLGTHTADVGGQPIGPAVRAMPAATWLPAVVTAVDRAAAALAVEQITFREAAEADAGPVGYENLWEARGGDGVRILEHAGYRRDPGFPPAYIDLREVQRYFPGDGDGVFAFYRHASVTAFAAYEAARAAWLAEAAAHRSADPGAALPLELALRHPHAEPGTTTSRLDRFRVQLFRSGLLPEALIALGQRDRAEGTIANAGRTARRLDRLRAVRDELARRAEAEAAALPAGLDAAVVLTARAIMLDETSTAGPVADPDVVRRLAAVHREEMALVAEVDPAFRALSSALRRKVLDLAAGRIRLPDVERRRVREALGRAASRAQDDTEVPDAELNRLLEIAPLERHRDQRLRALRTEIADLTRRTGIRPEEAEGRARAHDLLAQGGGRLDAEIDRVAARLAAARERLEQATGEITDGERRLERERRLLEVLLLGRAAEVRDGVERAMRVEFRREQDRIVAQRCGALDRISPDERRAALESAVAHPPLDFGRVLLGLEALRDSDRDRILEEHEAFREAIRQRVPDQGGPIPPAFDSDGYFASGLAFTGRDERVWTNLSDQDRISQLYHETMARSMIRHDVIDWPYLAAYREAGRATGDELNIATLRAGRSDGPIVAAVTVKRSPAGHFRPERIAFGGPDFGAYYSLVILVMANEVSLGGTLCSLGQTSQGTKLREFGASFIDVREYTKFRGLVPRVFGFDRIRRQTFRHVHLERLLELAALPPEERDAAARRHGIRWHI